MRCKQPVWAATTRRRCSSTPLGRLGRARSRCTHAAELVLDAHIPNMVAFAKLKEFAEGMGFDKLLNTVVYPWRDRSLHGRYPLVKLGFLECGGTATRTSARPGNNSTRWNAPRQATHHRSSVTYNLLAARHFAAAASFVLSIPNTEASKTKNSLCSCFRSAPQGPRGKVRS